MATDWARPGYKYDARRAELVVRFFERLLTHVKGEWAGKPFKLLQWQRAEIIEPLFGYIRPDGLRRFRRAYVEIPRKNAKSTLAAGLALYMLFADDEAGAEVYSAAADKDQASIVFEVAKSMVESSPSLASRAQIYKKSIVVRSTGSVYRVLSADAFTKHGLNASGIIFDELHAQPNRELWDVLSTSQGARSQPLLIAITTAGYDKQSICYQEHEYSERVLSGVVDDPAHFAYIAAAEAGDDWTLPTTWAKANPGLGVTVKLDYIEAEARRALSSPAYQNTFRRLHLNQWTAQESRWLDLAAWDKCGSTVDPALLRGAVCYGGLDLASTGDLASFVLVFPTEPGEDERYTVMPFFWIPGESVVERARRDRVDYDAWARDGFITATPGNVIDYERIVADIVRLSETYNIREIAFDRWGAFQVSQNLDGAGLSMVGFGQGFASMSAPTKELLRLVLDGRLSHGNHPVLRWNADNVVVMSDPAGNVKPAKDKSREKIDGIVALIMGLDRAIKNRAASSSIYESRGVIII